MTFDNFLLWKTHEKENPLCVIESNCRDAVFNNFMRDFSRDALPSSPFFRFDNLAKSELSADGETTMLEHGEKKEESKARYDKITVNRV